MNQIKKISTFLLILLLFFLSGCKNWKTLINLASDEMTCYNSNQIQKFQLEDNRIIVPININGDTQKWIFDTHGSACLFLKNDSWIDTLTRHPLPKATIERDAAGNSFERSLIVLDSANCNLFTINNWIVNGINPMFLCNDYSGIFGGNLFNDKGSDNDTVKPILMMNFDDSTLCCINEIPDDSWHKVKAKFFIGHVYIFININGKEYKCGLDTGYKDEINLVSKEEVFDDYPTKNIVYGHLFQTAGGIVDGFVITKIIDNVEITKDIHLKSEIRIVPKEMNNLVGMDFIQNFNWILDYENKDVYIQPRKIQYIKEETVLSNPEILGASIKFDKNPARINNLTKGGKAENSGLMVNDIILSINNIDVDNISLCEREEFFKSILESGNIKSLVVERGGDSIIINM